MFHRTHHIVFGIPHLVSQLWRRVITATEVVELEIPNLCALL